MTTPASLSSSSSWSGTNAENLVALRPWLAPGVPRHSHFGLNIVVIKFSPWKTCENIGTEIENCLIKMALFLHDEFHFLKMLQATLDDDVEQVNQVLDNATRHHDFIKCTLDGVRLSVKHNSYKCLRYFMLPTYTGQLRQNINWEAMLACASTNNVDMLRAILDLTNEPKQLVEEFVAAKAQGYSFAFSKECLICFAFFKATFAEQENFRWVQDADVDVDGALEAIQQHVSISPIVLLIAEYALVNRLSGLLFNSRRSSRSRSFAATDSMEW
jgi:hypothetical protein